METAWPTLFDNQEIQDWFHSSSKAYIDELIEEFEIWWYDSADIPWNTLNGKKWKKENETLKLKNRNENWRIKVKTQYSMVVRRNV